ncbi:MULTISPECIES: hypothetical protein [Dermabacter]|nr:MULTISPECIES: hypothetical protein [Dermabacter]MCT1955412.1 hypothetical protein [Dermabacter hominis]MCT2025881.1 hypothetical protein [Dermabacter hominis]MDU2057723.1 hypothetical protein [Dermabacter sp.]
MPHNVPQLGKARLTLFTHALRRNGIREKETIAQETGERFSTGEALTDLN